MRILSCLIILFVLNACRENSNSVQTTGSTPTSTTLNETSENAPEPMPELQSVEDIQKEYNYISSLIESGRMDSMAKNYNCRDEKKGTITWFSENGQLRMIKHSYSEYDHYSASDYYYIKDGYPFFVYYKSISWFFSSDEQGRQGTTDNITEKRFYIIDEKPVRCLEKKFKIVSTAVDKAKPESVVNKEVDCPSIEPILKKYRLLDEYRTREEKSGCLGD